MDLQLRWLDAMLGDSHKTLFVLLATYSWPLVFVVVFLVWLPEEPLEFWEMPVSVPMVSRRKMVANGTGEPEEMLAKKVMTIWHLPWNPTRLRPKEPTSYTLGC